MSASYGMEKTIPQPTRKKLRQITTDAKFANQLHHHMHQVLFNTQEFEHFKHFTLFAGLLPNDWKHQAIPSTSITTTNSQQQQRWAQKLSEWLTAQGHELWSLRNHQLYNNSDTMSQVERALNNKIHQLYQLKNSIGYHDQDIFSQPIEERLSLSEKQKMMCEPSAHF